PSRAPRRPRPSGPVPCSSPHLSFRMPPARRTASRRARGEVRMKGDPKIIALLNEVLKKELTGINQYFVHAKMCQNWGYDGLAMHARAESIDEMKHADRVI